MPNAYIHAFFTKASRTSRSSVCFSFFGGLSFSQRLTLAGFERGPTLPSGSNVSSFLSAHLSALFMAPQYLLFSPLSPFFMPFPLCNCFHAVRATLLFTLSSRFLSTLSSISLLLLLLRRLRWHTALSCASAFASASLATARQEHEYVRAYMHTLLHLYTPMISKTNVCTRLWYWQPPQKRRTENWASIGRAEKKWEQWHGASGISLDS